LTINNTIYEGSWYLGKKHGNFTIYYSNGNTYQGQFENNQKSGYGTYTWKNGDKKFAYY
jgi:hypothetical protein